MKSTDTYWRIIGNDQKFYDFDLFEAQAQLQMIASDATTIDCERTRTIGKIIFITPLIIEVK